MLAESFWSTQILGIFYVWQIPIVLALIALIIFWKIYRSKQM
jgi:hypothetical protein